MAAFPLLPVSALLGEKVVEMEFGTNGTLTLEGDVQSGGCRFTKSEEINQSKVTCCYSAELRGDDLCDPAQQGDRCRKKDSFLVEELEETRNGVMTRYCILHLQNIQTSDGGKYDVVFPGKTSDSGVINLKVRKWTELSCSLPWVLVAVSLLISIILAATLLIMKFKPRYLDTCCRYKLLTVTAGQNSNTREGNHDVTSVTIMSAGLVNSAENHELSTVTARQDSNNDNTGGGNHDETSIMSADSEKKGNKALEFLEKKKDENEKEKLLEKEETVQLSDK